MRLFSSLTSKYILFRSGSSFCTLNFLPNNILFSYVRILSIFVSQSVSSIFFIFHSIPFYLQGVLVQHFFTAFI